MLRRDLQNLARLRLKEARRLLAEGYYSGAYYLAGIGVECAIKACIAKKTQRHEFPPSRKYSDDCFQHDFGRLITTAGLRGVLDAKRQSEAVFDANWAIVSKWTIDDRYNDKITRQTAREYYSAVSARQHGVLTWLRLHW